MTDFGVPPGEKQPPHGAIRWDRQLPKDGPDGQYRVTLQWIYELDKIDGC